MRLGGWGLAAAALATLAPLAAGSPLGFDSHVVAVERPGVGYNYAVPHVVADVAGTLTFTNADLRAHDVVAVDFGPDDNPWCGRYVGLGGCPLFASPLIGFAEQATVEGVGALAPGQSYAFYCTVHPWMTGTLTAV